MFLLLSEAIPPLFSRLFACVSIEQLEASASETYLKKKTVRHQVAFRQV
jgi:hypothetical protein